MPQNDEGMRIEPPVSLPSAAMHCPDATDEPDPPLEPPVIREVSHGLWASPSWGFSLDGPQRELVHLQLAHQHRARLAEALRNPRVVVRHEVGEYPGADARAHAAGVVQVLQAHGNAVQRPEASARPHGVLGRTGLGGGLLGHHP